MSTPNERTILIVLSLALCAYIAFIMPSPIAKEIILVALGGVFGMVSARKED